MPKHFHTIEIAFVGAAGAIIALHAGRFIGAKLAKSDSPGVSKFGRAVLGVVLAGGTQ